MKNFFLIITLLTLGFWTELATAQIRMSGTVTNVSSEPLVGVFVSVEGTSISQLTDFSGQFNLKIPDKYSDQKVVISYYGYDNDTIPVTYGTVNVVLGLKILQTRSVAYVSTQKRLQTNFEVPVTLSVADNSKIDFNNITNPQELSLYSPGYHNQTQSGVYSVNVIRGVASDGSNSYSFFQPRISVFVDGVSVTHMGTASQDIFDMQRVEVVRGPQGTLFGKGAEFGAISYHTNKPVDEFEANVQMMYGQYNQKIVSGMVNTPFSTDMTNRLSFYYNNRDGYNTNLSDNSSLSGKGAIAVRDILRWQRGENVTLTISVDYERDREPCVSYKGAKMGVPDNEDDVSPFTPAYFNEDNLFVRRDMGGFSYVVDHQLSPSLNYSSTTAIRGYKLGERYDLDGTYLPVVLADETQKGLQISEEIRVNWDNHSKLNGFVGVSYMYDRNQHSMRMNTNLRYTFSYLIRPTLQNILNSLPDDIVDGVNDALDQVMSGYYKMLPQYATDMESVMQRLKVTAAEKIKASLADEYSNMFNSSQWDITPDVYGHTTSIVYDVMVDAIREAFATDAAAQAFTQYVDPVAIVDGLKLKQIFANLQQYSNLEMRDDYHEDETDINVYHSGDVFADLVYKATDKLFFTLGMRGTLERQKTSYLSNSDEAPLVGAFIYHSTAGEECWLHDLELSWVGRAVVNYMLDKTNNVYFSFSKGRRPGSIYYNFAKSKAVKLRPEMSLNYELGLKGSLMKNYLVYSFAGFYYDWLNFQSSVSTEGVNGIREYVNTDRGKANALGAEASLEVYLPKYASFFADYSYINAKFTDKDSDGKPQDLAGHRFRMTPENSFDFGVDLTLPVFNKAGVYVRPSYSWMSDMYFSTDNTKDLYQEAYGIANLSVGVNLSYHDMIFDISLYGKNIFDKQYLIDAGNTGQIWGYPTYIAGPPAMFGVALKMGFR